MKKFFYMSLTILFFSSCGVKYQTVPYFVDLSTEKIIQEDIQNKMILKIQKDDVLAITVSSLNSAASSVFNLGNTSAIQSGSTSGSTLNGFTVDQNGNIQLPYLGSVHVEGLSTANAREIIQSKLVNGDFLKEPVVALRLANFKISVLGDVARPGIYPVQSERLTVMEALSMSGDLTITAKRNNVLLIRENQGKRQQIRLDLQSKDLFDSPYYYLQNNDMLYVQPGEAKYASVDTSYRNLSIILSTLSVVALVISRLF